MERWRDLGTSIGLLILRLGIGGFMAVHGYGKFQMVLNGDFDKFADPIGIGVGLSLVMVMIAEFFCAILVMAGCLTRLAALPVVFAMCVAAFIVHGNDPWTMQPTGGSKEPALLFAIPFLTLIFTGPGKFSIDALVMGRCCAKTSPENPAAP